MPKARNSPVSNKAVNNVPGVDFNNQHSVELLAVILSQVWLTYLKKNKGKSCTIYSRFQVKIKRALEKYCLKL